MYIFPVFFSVSGIFIAHIAGIGYHLYLSSDKKDKKILARSIGNTVVSLVLIGFAIKLI
jgi:hypothetical protein